MTLDPVETLSQLVAIPSVNPMGIDRSDSSFGEARLTACLESIFDRLGIEHQRQTAEPGRDNLIARLDGDVPVAEGGPLILFGAHQDTVPVEGMTIGPFEPTVRGGRLHGRGACDVKGGMAAMLVTLSRLAAERPPGMPTIVMACTVNEENGFTGITRLTESIGDPAGPIPRRPDAAIIAEPTDLDVVVAHKGVVRWRCHAPGRAGHSARPDSGENAIYKMAQAVTALQRYQNEVLASREGHPRCGRATLSVGTIRGGASVNTIPDSCTIEIDRRLRPDEEPEAAVRQLVQFLDDSLDFGLEHEPPYMTGRALADDLNGPLADRLIQIAADLTGECRSMGVPYATDAAALGNAGIPTVVFGPGSIEQAHTKDEWISLEQLEQASEILYRFVQAKP